MHTGVMDRLLLDHFTPKGGMVRLRPLLHLPGLKLRDGASYLRALDLYAAYGIDFEDCLSIAHLQRQNMTAIYSYDHDFDRANALRNQVSGIKGLNP